jgi:hypothetical protein
MSDMTTQYKIGKLDHAVYLSPGDRFRLSYTEDRGGDDKTTILHTEDITKNIECTHYAVLSTPFSVGMLIGTIELVNFLEESFPGCGVGKVESIL